MKLLLELSLFFVCFSTSIFAGEPTIQTILLWPETPPGAMVGDSERATRLADSIKDGSYQVPQKNRLDIRVPSIDVYLPPKKDANGVAMVIFCGGGYGAVCIVSEGRPMQQFLNDNGIAVFMVSYRCSPFNHPIPLWDAQRALRIVRSRAQEFGVDVNKIGAMGFSAGGHEASTLSVHYDEPFGYQPIDAIDQVSARPDFSCLIYPVISMRQAYTHRGSCRNLLGARCSEALRAKLSNDEQVDQLTPPAFLAHGTADNAVKPENSKRYHEACIKNGVPTKLVLVEGGMHGPAILNGQPAIRKTKDPYADSMIQWINDLFAH
jgi:acetyl esterase/lipase